MNDVEELHLVDFKMRGRELPPSSKSIRQRDR